MKCSACDDGTIRKDRTDNDVYLSWNYCCSPECGNWMEGYAAGAGESDERVILWNANHASIEAAFDARDAKIEACPHKNWEAQPHTSGYITTTNWDDKDENGMPKMSYSEAQLVPIIERLIAKTGYDRYALVSDDVVLKQSTYDFVMGLHTERGDVATGWCNLDNTGSDCTINTVPLTDNVPSLQAYNFLPIEAAEQLPREPVRTYFHGYALTVMTRELWLRYPYLVYGADHGGWASDFHQCVRLQQDNIPVWTHPFANMHHVKELANKRDRDPAKRIHVGERLPKVTIEREYFHYA